MRPVPAAEQLALAAFFSRSCTDSCSRLLLSKVIPAGPYQPPPCAAHVEEGGPYPTAADHLPDLDGA